MAVTLERNLIQADIGAYTDKVISRSEGVEDKSELEKIHSEEMAELLINTIKRIRITIPSGVVSVVGPGNVGAPVISANTAPIVLELTVD